MGSARGFFVIPALSTDDVVVTGVGFTPGSLNFEGAQPHDDDRFTGVATPAAEASYYWEASIHIDTTKSIKTGRINAEVKTWDDDGFTIRVNSNTSNEDILVIYEANLPT